MVEGTSTLFTPPPRAACSTKKNHGPEKFNENFSILFMRFTDGTDKVFPSPPPGTSTATVVSNLNDIQKAFADRQGMADGWQSHEFDMDMDFLDTRIGGIKGHDYFYAQF